MTRTSRRRFLQGTALVGAAFAGASARAVLSGHATPGRGVGIGAIFNEQAYLDFNGLGLGYRPPQGVRGLAATAHLDEAQFRMAHPYT